MSFLLPLKKFKHARHEKFSRLIDLLSVFIG